MAATRAELAEDTAVYLLPRPTFETIDRGELVYVAGMRNATVHRVRTDDVVAALAWTREESRRRGLRMVEWWLGWSATPPDAREQLLELGLVPDEVPTLTGMTSSVAPPEVAAVEVRRVETAAEYAGDDRDRLGGLAAERGGAGCASCRRARSVGADPPRRRRAPLRGVRRRSARRLRPCDRHGGGGRAVRRRGAAGGAGTRRLPCARPGALGARNRARHAAPRRPGGSHVGPRS